MFIKYNLILIIIIEFYIKILLIIKIESSGKKVGLALPKQRNNAKPNNPIVNKFFMPHDPRIKIVELVFFFSFLVFKFNNKNFILTRCMF